MNVVRLELFFVGSDIVKGVLYVFTSVELVPVIFNFSLGLLMQLFLLRNCFHHHLLLCNIHQELMGLPQLKMNLFLLEVQQMFFLCFFVDVGEISVPKIPYHQYVLIALFLRRISIAITIFSDVFFVYSPSGCSNLIKPEMILLTRICYLVVLSVSLKRNIYLRHRNRLFFFAILILLKRKSVLNQNA